MLNRAIFLLLVLAAPAALSVPRETGPLAEYVAKADASYAWEPRLRAQRRGSNFVELRLTSQTWRDIPWRHQLYVLVPDNVAPDNRHALLVIDGGKWRGEYDEPPAADAALPRRAEKYLRIAKRLGTPVAIVRQVPYQPILDGLTEDRAIAYTFERYLETGDPEWPLLLPMVKSAVRAMDAVQELARTEWAMPLETFTVVGGSKRGWTTWLTGAVDARVTALAPVVIDVVNMGPQIEHQQAVWGAPSYKIGPYTERGLHERLASDAGLALREIVDPYSYREHITQPKLIVLGTNDHYWPLDALNLYWDGLVGPKYILYVPNNGHDIEDYNRVLGSALALHRHAATGAHLPDLEWTFTEDDDAISLRVGSDVPPRQLRAWTAVADSQDFRSAAWTSRRFRRDGDSWVFKLPRPESGYGALFGELSFGKRNLPYFLSTNVRVIGADAPQRTTDGPDDEASEASAADRSAVVAEVDTVSVRRGGRDYVGDHDARSDRVNRE